MFSIHCKVLRVGRKKKKKAYWFKRERKGKLRAKGTHHRNLIKSLVSSPLTFSITWCKNKIRGLKRPDCSAECSCS